jgi:3-hydroxyacyl-[acyl-carrier-protein] dehydratase
LKIKILKIMTETYQIPYPKDLLPHRTPMLLIDEIDEYVPGISIKVRTHIKPDSMFFEGHFPNDPILPGIVLIEMMFQACGVFGRLENLHARSLAGEVIKDTKAKSGRAIKIDSASFSRPVYPNDTLIIYAEPKQKLFGFSVFHAKVDIEGKGTAAKGVVTVLITN